MHLVMQFLGAPQLSVDDQPIATDRRKAVALLAYLAVNDLGRAPQRYSREAMSALLWPDYEQAKAFSNLRRTIWEVHQALGEGCLIADRETVQLNPDADMDLDVAHFQSLLSKSRKQTVADLRIPLLVDTIRYYRNDFLTGFNLKDARPFNEWAAAESQELRHQLADSLSLLVESYCALDQAEEAASHARRLVMLDPLNEAAHRQLMQVYSQAGQANAALKQYHVCEQILRKELNLDPQPETRALYKKIRKGEARKSVDEESVEKPEKTEPKHDLPVRVTTVVDREKEQYLIPLAAETQQRTETWMRPKRSTVFLGFVVVGILLWGFIPALIPAGAVMPFQQKDGMKLHYVPAGLFIMGSAENGRGPGGEMPVHKVALDAYWIDETEITNAMYAQCVMTGACLPPSKNSSARRESYYDEKQYADYPVVNVSWNDANTYCQWAGRALPSEAQWEKAARGTDGSTYPWGNQVPDKDFLNYNLNIGDTTEVGVYPNGKSDYGAFDMAGNVWEWVADWYGYDYYASSPRSNPLGPESGQDRVLRGGAWGLNDCGFAAADRCSINPYARYADLGFRCALSSP